MPAKSRSLKEKQGQRAAKKRGTVGRIKDAISRREVEGDPQSRVGSGGRTRANRIDDAVERSQTGRKR